MMVKENTKILINCLLLSQCSGGYRSYFRNVIIPLVYNLNEQNIYARVLIPHSCKGDYEQFFNYEHIIFDTKSKKGFFRIFHEQKYIPRLVKQYGFTKVYTPYQIGPVRIKGAESILMFRNMEPY